MSFPKVALRIILTNPGSSAVTHAQVSFPQYFDPIQEYADQKCISALQSAIRAIDILLDLPEPVPTGVKSLFGLEQLEDNSDFGDVLISPLGTSLSGICLRADYLRRQVAI